MRTVAELMTKDIVWVSPSAPIKSAVILMKRHKIGALPVVEADESVAGLLTLELVLGEPADRAVSEVMQADFATVEPTASAFEAAEQMHRAGVSHLVALDQARVAGIVSRSDLMPELGKTFDPLTNLPWSDRLREWATAALKRGDEIAMILFDLNDYRQYNKVHGHVVGDRVIQEVAEILRSGTDPKLDFVCRYGGDEFGIVSVRHADEARSLATILQERIAALKVEGAPGGVSATFGMSGGRRSREREEIHYAATIDDLITRASKDCTAHKPRRAEAEAALEAPARPPSKAPRLKIRSITVSTAGAEATVGVTLTRGASEYKREVSDFATGGRDALRLVARAVAGAASQSLAPEHGVAIDEVLVQSAAGGEDVVTVVATFLTPSASTRHAGGAVVKRGDQYTATAAATLDAINRLIETAPPAETQPQP